jgi:catechol 2,3-dioxygenase-like lactoylglutathione lyase family enzyme
MLAKDEKLGILTKVHHVGFTVKSLERSTEFYRDILGMEEVFSYNPQAAYIGTLTGYPKVNLKSRILRLPGVELFLELLEYSEIKSVKIDHGNGNPGIAHIAFYVDDLDSMYEKLSLLGVESVSLPVVPTMGPNRGGKAVYMVDPDGYRIELIQISSSFADYNGTD